MGTTETSSKSSEVMIFTFQEGVYETEPAYLLMLNQTICKIYYKKYYSPARVRELAGDYITAYEKLSNQVVHPQETVPR